MHSVMCPISPYLDFSVWTVEVRCESTPYGKHWAGITFHNTSSSAEISFLNVEYAGIRKEGNRTLVTQAIRSNGIHLAMR